MKIPRYLTAGSPRTWRPGRDEELPRGGARHVGPPVPGRDADLLREIVDAEDRPALVAAGDDEDARRRPARAARRLDDARPPSGRGSRGRRACPARTSSLDLRPLRPSVPTTTRRRPAGPCPRRAPAGRRSRARMSCRRSPAARTDARVVPRVDHDRHGDAIRNEREGASAGDAGHERRATERECRGGGAEQDGRGAQQRAGDTAPLAGAIRMGGGTHACRSMSQPGANGPDSVLMSGRRSRP